MVVAVVLCVASAVAYAAAAVLQEKVAGRTPRAFLRLPTWWTALGLNGAGAVLHLVALRYGPLSLVQALGVLTLVFAAGVRRGATGTERRGVAVTVLGLLALMVVTGTGSGATSLTPVRLVGLLLAAAAALTALGGRSRTPGASALWAAAAGGVAFGASSAVSQTVAVQVTAGGVARPAVVVGVLAVAGLTTAGLLFTQRSYTAGLGAPLAVSTLTNPLTAAAVGLMLLDERFTAGPVGVLVACAGAASVAVGVNLLTAGPATVAHRGARGISGHPVPADRGRPTPRPALS